MADDAALDWNLLEEVEQDIDIEVEVRKMFLPLFSPKTLRFAIIVAHRRAGKTVASLQRLYLDAVNPEGLPNRRYIYVAPLRVQAKYVAWDYLKGFARQTPGCEINESELRVDFKNGSRIQLFGADNPDSARGGYLDGVVLDEYAQMDPRMWSEVIRPMLSDRKGWAQFIGTPQGKNSFYELWEKAASRQTWMRMMLPASLTKVVPQPELDAALEEMGEDAYSQEYECSWTAAIKGAFWGKIMEKLERNGHMLPLDYDPQFPVTTTWDLGVTDAQAIWFLQPYRGNSWAVIDYYESYGEGIEHYIDWLRQTGYSFYRHIGPHDTKSVEWSSGRKRIEIARSHGLEFTLCPNHKVYDGIQAVRTLLPRVYFHYNPDDPTDARSARVYRGRLALSLYRTKHDPTLGAFAVNPIHDWTSHPSDAFRYFAMADEQRGTRADVRSEADDPNFRINLRGQATQRLGSTLGSRVRG